MPNWKLDEPRLSASPAIDAINELFGASLGKGIETDGRDLSATDVVVSWQENRSFLVLHERHRHTALRSSRRSAYQGRIAVKRLPISASLPNG